MHKLFHTFRRVPRLFYHTRRRSPSALLHRYSHKKGEDTRRLKAERADIFVSWKIFPVEEEWCEDEAQSGSLVGGGEGLARDIHREGFSILSARSRRVRVM